MLLCELGFVLTFSFWRVGGGAGGGSGCWLSLLAAGGPVGGGTRGPAITVAGVDAAEGGAIWSRFSFSLKILKMLLMVLITDFLIPVHFLL